MKLEILALTIVTLSCSVLTDRNFRCSRHTALVQHKRGAYEFSIKLLQRVAVDRDAHFVYSPLSTWIQLIALSEGAKGTTFREIWNVTQHRRNKCFKKKLGEIMYNLRRDVKRESRKKIVLAMDRLLGVKKSYVRKVESLFGIKVLLLDFHNPTKSALEVNNAIEEGTGGEITEILYYDDFITTVLLMSDANYFRSAWKTPFNKAYTQTQPFYSDSGILVGKVSMMNQRGYFNLLEFPQIGANVLELPFANKEICMLIFLPRTKMWVGEILYSLQNTRLTSIFNLYKLQGLKLVNVTIPQFKQRTEVDNLPELIYDMGVKKIFDPNLAELKGISNYKMYASLMTQVSHIEINEEGVTAGVEFLAINDTSIEFLANKPFVYMIVHRKSEFILYAGVYSTPSVI